MSKVDFTLIEKPPEKSLIEHLENLLEEAKSGELQELAYVCSYKGSSVNHGWTRLENNRRIIGELEYMKQHIIESTK